MRMLKDRVEDVSTGDLLRAYFSYKEYISFEFHVFNTGVVTKVVCTDRYKEPLDNGYDFIVDNTISINYALKEILINRLKRINESWTKWCYHKDWSDFLRDYGLTENKYKRLLKLENK